MKLEFFGVGTQLSIEPIEYVDSSAELTCDRNWIRTRIILRLGDSYTEVQVMLQTTDFSTFLDEVRGLTSPQRNGVVKFETIEEVISFSLTKEQAGVSIAGKIRLASGRAWGILDFQFPCLTSINKIMEETEEIVLEFPVLEDSAIRHSAK